MHRLTARLLLLFALLGSVAPIAFAVTAPPPHACCLRKGVHHCHESPGSESDQPVIQDASCCHGDCARAVTTAQWAHPQPKLAAFFLQANNVRLAACRPHSPTAASVEFQSSRAPPAC
ncbi:MAG: hypothetical protein WCC99_02285 [Candidatus Sulfotelmatobacter sp.]